MGRGKSYKWRMRNVFMSPEIWLPKSWMKELERENWAKLGQQTTAVARDVHPVTEWHV